MGGWLLTEPSWMFDQFSAAAEGDLVGQLRSQGGDAYAISTMKNHWAGYIPDAAFDTMNSFGITHVRIPVGYWIFDTAVGATSPYEYGFNHEGFVTGGLNYLEAALAKLKTRNIHALIDMHALPGEDSAYLTSHHHLASLGSNTCLLCRRGVEMPELCRLGGG